MDCFFISLFAFVPPWSSKNCFFVRLFNKFVIQLFSKLVVDVQSQLCELKRILLDFEVVMGTTQ